MDADFRTEQLRKRLEKTLVNINIALRFSEPVLTEDVEMAGDLLQELFISSDDISKEILSMLYYSFPYNYELDLKASSFEETVEINELATAFRCTVLQALETKEVPDDQTRQWVEQLGNWVTNIHEHPSGIDELLMLLDAINLAYETSETLPKALAFSLFKLLGTCLGKNPMCLRGEDRDFRRDPIQQAYLNIYNRIIEIYTLKMTNDASPKYVTGDAIEGLKAKIGFPKEFDDFGEDWEFVVADASRLDEFLQAYVELDLSIEEKFALMMIIAESYNDLLWAYEIEPDELEPLRQLLIKDFTIHKEGIKYWVESLEDIEDPEDAFPIAFLMKDLLESQIPRREGDS